jgi:hypothetical protein
LLTPIPRVSEFSVIDVLGRELSESDRDAALDSLAVVHDGFFPDYSHVLEDLRTQIRTGLPPEGEIVHAWLVFREGEPVGEWIFNLNIQHGVVMMLFGGIDRDARRGLAREYLEHFVNYLLDVCVQEANALGIKVYAVVLESDTHLIERWQSCGFFLADAEYREPIHGVHWKEFGDLAFFDDYSAMVLPISDGLTLPKAELARRCISGLLIDHYGLPPEHESVAGSLERVARLAP